MAGKPVDRIPSKEMPREHLRGPSPLSNLNNLGPTLVLLAVLLLGFGLRLYRLGEQNIWWDEGHAVWTARQSLAQTTDITAHDVHPPLYLWLLHAWLRLTGESELAVRYLSVIGGLLTVALTYVVARRLVGRRAALLATLLIATARFHIWWSQEARMYVWATFFALLSIHAFIHLRHGRNLTWWSYVLASVAAMYTLYLAALVLLLENVFVAITVWRQPRRKRFLFTWALSQSSILVLYTPWLYTAMAHSRTDIAKIPFPFSLVWKLYGTVLATGISTDLDRYTWLLVVFALLSITGIALLFLDRRQPQRYGFAGWEVGLLLLLPLVLPPMVVYGLSVPRGIYYSPKPEARYLLLFAPLFHTLLAGTMTSFWQRGPWGRSLTIAVTLLVLGTFVSVLPAHYAGRYLRDDYQTAMQTLEAYAQPGDAILLVSGDRYPVFLYHYHRRFPDGNGPRVYLMPQQSTQFTSENIETELAPLAERHPRLWLGSFERTLQDPQDLAAWWLDEQLRSMLHVPLGHNYLRLYAGRDLSQTLALAKAHPQVALEEPCPLGDGVSVGGYDLATDEFRPGDTLRLALYLDLDPGHSRDTRDTVVDLISPGGQVIDSRLISVPAGSDDAPKVRVIVPFAVYRYTPPGRYAIEVSVSGNDGQRCQLPAGRVTHSRRLPAPRIADRQTAQLEGGLVLFEGYTMRPPAQVRAGKALIVDLYWQATRRLEKDYTVFVHMLGPYNSTTGGPLWAQDDSYPMGGQHPTTRWLPTQTARDRHLLLIPESTPPGTYQIEVGLYDSSTGERLQVDGSVENRILLNDIQITER